MSSNLNKLTEEIQFSYSYRDAYNNPFPSHILELFQDIGSDHADKLGVGYNEMVKKNIIWVITKNRYHIYQDMPYDNLTLTTWPLQKGALSFDREYVIKDLNSNVIVKGTSKWCLVDINTRKLLLSKVIDYIGIEDFCTEVNFEDPYENLMEFEHNEENYLKSFDVNFSLLDHNFHLNNTHYASFILDSIKNIKGKKIIDLQINYLAECKFNDEIKTFYKEVDENTLMIEGIRQDDVVSFLSLVKIESI